MSGLGAPRVRASSIPKPKSAARAPSAFRRSRARKVLVAQRAAMRSAAAQASVDAKLRALEEEEKEEREEDLEEDDSNTSGLSGVLNGVLGFFGASKKKSSSSSRSREAVKDPLDIEVKMDSLVPAEFLTSSGTLDTSADSDELERRVQRLKRLLAKERNRKRRAAIQTAINQLLRAARLARQRRGSGRIARGSSSAALPATFRTSQLEDKLAQLIRRRDSLQDKVRKNPASVASDPTISAKIVTLSKRIDEIQKRIDRLDTLPTARRNSEVLTIDRALNTGSDMARGLEQNPKLRYGPGNKAKLDNRGAVTEDEETTEETAPVPAESAAAAAAIAEEPWWRRNLLLLAGVGVVAAVAGTYYFTRSGSRAST